MTDHAAKLKIGLILDTSLDTAEGVPQYVMHVGEWLRAQGHDVHYLVGETKRTDLPNIHSLSRNIAVSFNGSRTTIPLPTSKRKLRRFMQSHSFDVLHVQTPHHPLLAQPLIMAAGAETAVVGTFHILPYGRLSQWGNKLLGIWLRPSLKRIDKMLAVSSAAATFCKQSFGASASVSPNVVDYQRFHNAKQLSELSSNKLTILFLGRLEERKGCRVLLEAIKLIADEDDLPDFQVVICGKGKLEKSLKNFVSQNRLEPSVTFAGFVSEELKPSYYAAADLAVFPSSSGESFGIVLIEAMASGRAAVLAGDNPGYRSVMAEQPELLFNPKNPSELAGKLRQFLKNSQLRQQMAAWGSEYTRKFDVNVVGNQLIGIYREALHKHRQL